MSQYGTTLDTYTRISIQLSLPYTMKVFASNQRLRRSRIVWRRMQTREKRPGLRNKHRRARHTRAHAWLRQPLKTLLITDSRQSVPHKRDLNASAH